MGEKEVKVLVAQSCRTLATLWTVACQAPLSMGFPQQEYWSGLPFSTPGDLPNQVIFLTDIQTPLFLIHLCMKNVKYTYVFFPKKKYMSVIRK